MKLLLPPLLLLACAFAIVGAIALVLRELAYERRGLVVDPRTRHQDRLHVEVSFFKRGVDACRARNDHRRFELRRASREAVEAVDRMQRNWRAM